MTLVFKKEVYDIVGACFEVYNERGAGFLEAVYQECLQIELELRGIPFQSQIEFPLAYKGRQLKQTYRGDLLCYGHVLVELKAVSELANEHRSQVLNYLHASGCRVGLLVNFGHCPDLQWERLVV